MKDDHRKRRIVIVVSVVVILFVLGTIITFLLRNEDTNKFGKYIKIQNYDKVIENTSPDIQAAMEAYLYKVVSLNVTNEIKGPSVKDAYIREGFATQEFNEGEVSYSGTLIIDIESLKQSYQASYVYFVKTPDLIGDPVVVSCLEKDQLKYGEFNCKDLLQEESGGDDEIIQYLPYEGLSFKISPNALLDENKLTLVVTLRIPENDLKGNVASRQQVVAVYKKEVNTWLTSKGLDPNNYLFKYNYDDSGNAI